MTEAELVEKVARAMRDNPHTIYHQARAVIPIIEANLLRDIRNWKPTEYGVYGWHNPGLVSFARERGLSLEDGE